MVSVQSLSYNRRRKLLRYIKGRPKISLILGGVCCIYFVLVIFFNDDTKSDNADWKLLHQDIAAVSRNTNVVVKVNSGQITTSANTVKSVAQPQLLGGSYHNHKHEDNQRTEPTTGQPQVTTESQKMNEQSNPKGNLSLNATSAMLPRNKPQHKMPQWMLDYFDWHQEQRSLMTKDNWDSGTFQYLIMRCLNRDPICGGTSDRLSSIPFQLLMGYEHKRILLIYWERPFPLEEFLLPPEGGVDWKVPSYMEDKLPLDDWAMTNAPRVVKNLASKQFQNKQIVWLRDQTHNHGRSDYNQHHEQLNINSNFDDVFHDAWRMVLTPAPPIAKETEYWMRKLRLVPGKYASTHVRALYGVHNRSLEQIEEWTINAIHCTTNLLPEGPFFFASDSTDAQKVALQYGQKQKLSIVSRLHYDKEPLHLETNSTGRKPSDYYDIFVDIYLLGNARAVSYNVGGYGRLALMLGFDAQAGIQHQRGGVPWKEGVTAVHLAPCELKRPEEIDDIIKGSSTDNTTATGSFFVPPMETAKE